MRNIAIVLAGGTGKRMNSNIPKQYMELNGKPILYYSLKTFEQSFIDEIILVCKSGDEEYCRKEIVDKYNIKKVTNIVSGGKERYNSVFNGLKCINDDGYVYIHDGARPFVTEDILLSIKEAFQQHKACVAGVPVKDTIKIVSENGIVEATPDREKLYQIQTPQAFETGVIKKAYNELITLEQQNKLQIKVTDDAMVVENFANVKVYITQGDYNNIKVTTPEDIVLGNIILNKNLG